MKDTTWAAASAIVLSKETTKRDLYHYSSLPPGHYSIRLLRLLPSKDKTAAIRCQLVNYSLAPGQEPHLYKALSYVWGDQVDTVSILIDEDTLAITASLHAALLHLRHHSFEQIIWVDAVCINQENRKEKEQQIQFMAKIYGHASHVIVWLGEAADNSNIALEAIRISGGKKYTNSSINTKTQQAVLALLQRPWFRRMWVRE
jgi:hypothetical protein